MREFWQLPKYALRFLQPGRVVHVEVRGCSCRGACLPVRGPTQSRRRRGLCVCPPQDGDTDWGWGALLNFRRMKAPGSAADGSGGKISEASAADVVVDCLLYCTPGKRLRARPVRRCCCCLLLSSQLLARDSLPATLDDL